MANDETRWHWVDSWGAMPQWTDPDALPTSALTLRQTVRVSIGGGQLRLRFSNAFGDSPLPIAAASVAQPAGGRAGISAIEPGTPRPIFFHGRSCVVVPASAQIVSDPLAFDLAAGANITVSLYLPGGRPLHGVTGHPGSRTTSYVASGDQVSRADLFDVASVEHWFLLNGLEVWSPPDAAAAVVAGDSLTDGRGSTTNGNDRWPDQLQDRLRASADTVKVAIVNQAGGGNRILNPGLGPSLLSRLERDVFAGSGVAWLVVFVGVNDIGTAEPEPAVQDQVAAELIAAYLQIIRRAHAHDIRVYGATITPFGGNADYDDPGGVRESTRQTVNQWIRKSERFDALVDFDAAVRDPSEPRRLLRGYDCGDHLHLSPAGYRALADAVPTHLFIRRPLPPGFGFD